MSKVIVFSIRYTVFSIETTISRLGKGWGEEVKEREKEWLETLLDGEGRQTEFSRRLRDGSHPSPMELSNPRSMFVVDGAAACNEFICPVVGDFLQVPHPPTYRLEPVVANLRKPFGLARRCLLLGFLRHTVYPNPT